MRPRILFGALVTVAVALLLGWLLRPRQSTDGAAPSTIAPGFSSAGPSATRSNDPSSGEVNSRERAAAEGPPVPATHRSLSGLPNSIEEWSEQVHRPIEFYGKVVDDKEQPVSGADVQFIWTHFRPEGSFKTNVQSDANGLFSLQNVTGAGLGVHVRKPGYYYIASTNQDSFNFNALPGYQPFRPERSDPVIFRLRKKGAGTELVTSRYGVSPDLEAVAPRNGGPVYVDLMNRKVGPDGQLEISQNKPEYMHVKEAKVWGFRMAIRGGGFIEENDEFPFEAPERGYQAVVEFQFNEGQTNWTRSLKKSFYIVFGEPPRYGWLTVETDIGWGGARLRYALNPDGSRYLEPRESKQQGRQPPPGITEVIPNGEK